MNIRQNMLISTAINSLRIRAFEPGKAGWKLDKDGHIELKDGNPIWIDANGGELTLGTDTITKLNGDVKTMRVRAETAETALVAFKDLDPVAAKKAIDLVKNIDAKKLIDAGEVEKVKDEIKAGFTAQMTELTTANQNYARTIDDMKVTNVFAGSEFIKSSVAVPADMFEATFRKNFKINKEGKIEVFDNAGNRINSKTNFGEPAAPDEALQILVDAHPNKGIILKAPDASGSGSSGGGGNRGGMRTIKRADFASKSPAEQATIAADAGAGKVDIID